MVRRVPLTSKLEQLASEGVRDKVRTAVSEEALTDTRRPGAPAHMHQANKRMPWKLGVIRGFAHHEDIPYDVLCTYHIIEKGYPHDDKPRA